MFPSYEDLFYQPPVPDVDQEPKVMNGFLHDDDEEGTIRDFLDEMRDWYLEQSEESVSRFQKPLPPPPVEESDDEDAIRKPFGAARALRKRIAESNEHFPTINSTSPLRLKTSTPSTPSTFSTEPKTPTLAVPFRPFADVPQSPISEVSVVSPYVSQPLQSSVRARSSSLSALKASRSEMHLRRPPPLKPSSKSLGAVNDHVLLHPGFNKSFSAPNTPTAAEFMQAKAERQLHAPNVRHLPYGNPSNHLGPVDARLRAATSCWSLSTAAQDDNSPPSPLSPVQPETPRKGLPRSPSRLGLNLSFSKFDFTKLVRFPSRSNNKKRLVIKGVASGAEAAVQSVKQWCEVYGAVDRLSQKANGEIHVHFRNRAVADRVCRTHTNVIIPEVGIVSLTYASGGKQK